MEQIFLAADQYNSPFSASAPLRGSKSVFFENNDKHQNGENFDESFSSDLTVNLLSKKWEKNKEKIV